MSDHASYRVERSSGESYYSADPRFDIFVSGLSRKDAEKLTAVASTVVLGEPEPVAPVYTARVYSDLRDLDGYKQEALVVAARLHFNSQGNRIQTIKFIRSLTTLGLKEAKDLVDYAVPTVVEFPDRPDWLNCLHPVNNPRKMAHF